MPLAAVRADLSKLSPKACEVALLGSERRSALVVVAVEDDDVQPEGAIVIPDRGVFGWVEVAPKGRLS